MQTCVIIRRILLTVLHGSFEMDFQNQVGLRMFCGNGSEFENGVSAAIKSTMALAGHEQVVAEFTILQLWTRANKVRCVPFCFVSLSLIAILFC